MFLPCVPPYGRIVLLLSLICGLGLPTFSAIALQKHGDANPLAPTVAENFDPPGDPVPSGTRGAGSRGIVVQPIRPNL